MAVVLFGNGGRQILASSCDDTIHYTVFTIDLDRNGVPDVGVITTKSNTPTTIRYFQNDAAGHFTEVTGPGSGPVQPTQPPSMGNPCGTS
jgi:hypothetical protein